MVMVVTGAVVGASVVPRWCGQDLFVDVVMDNTGLHDTGPHSLAVVGLQSAPFGCAAVIAPCPHLVSLPSAHDKSVPIALVSWTSLLSATAVILFLVYFWFILFLGIFWNGLSPQRLSRTKRTITSLV